MGPFVPDVITDQLNLVVALLIGIAFGYVLEQAGFSSSRRLAGLFYGYDFTVLRVFFTAAVTAMAGILLLGYFGALDLSLIYINPTFLWPAVVGGVVMGLGFILGGYCPGTSVAAASIGKVDAWWFVLGGVVGIFGFGEAYPLLQKFNDSSSLGAIKVYESIHVSQGVFAFGLIAMAVAAFAATTWIEQKVNRDAPTKLYSANKHRMAGAAVLALGLALLVLPDRKTALLSHAPLPVATMDADELAFRLVDRDPNLKLYDLRDEQAYKALALPGSTRVTVDDLMGRSLAPELSHPHVRKVFVAMGEKDEKAAASLATRLGYSNATVLTGGFRSFEQAYLADSSLPAAGNEEQTEIRDWKLSARQTIRQQIAEAKKKGSAGPKKEKKIKGGC